jgi:regulator of protease activity HflC (stomatin/prohibitin superfamily)
MTFNIPGKMIAIGALVVALLMVTFGSFYTVSQNEVVVLTRWGEIVDPQVGPGLHWKWPFAYTANHQLTAIQEIIPEINNRPVNTYTVDNQEVDVTFHVYYRVAADKAAYILINVPDYSQRLTSMAIDRLKSAMGQINIQQLAEKRNAVRSEILATLKADALSLGLEITDIQLTDFQYDPKFREAVANAAVQKANIEANEYVRQQAEKTALTAQITALGVANGVREKAKGDADALLVLKQAEAKGIELTGLAQAAAIRAQTDALRASPDFVAYTQARQWNGQLPTFMGNGPVPFINIPAATLATPPPAK